MSLKKWLFLTFIISGFFVVTSQEKFEREYRVDAHKIPRKARAFIEKCTFKKRVKWFAEESQDGKTFEAKSYKNGYKFSIEFDSNGNILDVEKTVKISEIQNNQKDQLYTTLSKRFEKYRIKKIQVQWKASDDTYIELINGGSNNDIEELYEIIVKGKVKSSYRLYELLIDKKGTILKELKMVPASSDNLQF